MNIDIVSAEEIIFPIIVSLLAAFSLWVFLCIILKNKNKSGLILSLGLFLFFTYGHFYNSLESSDQIIIPHEIFLTIFLTVFIIGTYFFIKTKKKLNNATTIMNFVALTLVVISIINVGTYYLDPDNFFEPVKAESDKKIDESKILDSYPDIYYIILDEYADSDMLKGYLGFDNQEFISFLEEKGFYVSAESYSNYRATWNSIPSTMNMDYFQLKPNEFDFSLGVGAGLLIPSSQFLTANSKVMQYLQSKGYDVVSISSGEPPTNTKGIADHYFCFDEDSNYSEFLPLLFDTSILNPLELQIWNESIREQRLCSFSALTDLDNISEKPIFVLSHMLFPHNPYIFGPNCEPIFVGSFIAAPSPTHDSFYYDGYIDNLQCANKKLKEVIEKLLDDEDPPVILIYSDHGFRHGEVGGFGGNNDFRNFDEERLQKRYNNFEAYYFPDKPRNFLLEETTNVNTFRILFNEYFNDNFEILDDKIFGAPNFTDYTELYSKIQADGAQLKCGQRHLSIIHEC